MGLYALEADAPVGDLARRLHAVAVGGQREQGRAGQAQAAVGVVTCAVLGNGLRADVRVVQVVPQYAFRTYSVGDCIAVRECCDSHAGRPLRV